MKTIKPFQVEGEPKVEGDPVEYFDRDRGLEKFDVVISCEKHQHRVTFDRGRVTIHDHSLEDIKNQQITAELWTPNDACPCVRLKIWEPYGYYIDI